jgi:hypothetical protein
MRKSIIDKLVDDLMPFIIKYYYHNELLCPNCVRKVPNKKHFTKNGCIFCDEKYHKKQKKLENFVKKYKGKIRLNKKQKTLDN